MAKRYRAEHITIFAVYKKITVLGEVGRYFKIALPNLIDAEKWVEEHCKNSRLFTKDDYIVEEMPAIMKAWNGK